MSGPSELPRDRAAHSINVEDEMLSVDPVGVGRRDSWNRRRHPESL